jgi:hypothetical protein
MYSRQDIQGRLNELIGKKNITKRFYHFRSIQNFIHFFDDPGSIQLKENVYSILMEYLEIVKKEPIKDIHQCTNLFDEYLRPVGNLYEDVLGFMPIIRFWVIFFWCIFLFGVLYMFNLSIIFYCIIGIIFSSYYLYNFKKRIEKKVYGLKW